MIRIISWENCIIVSLFVIYFVKITGDLLENYTSRIIATSPRDPGRCGNNFRSIILKLIILNSTSDMCVKFLSGVRMPQSLNKEKSTAPSHYLSHCVDPYLCHQTDGLGQERRNSIAYALELRLSCTNPSKWHHQATNTCAPHWWLVIISSGNGLVLLGNKPLTEPVLSKSITMYSIPRGQCVNWLTHCGLVTPYGDMYLDQHWLRQWLVAWQQQAITWTNVDLSSLRSSDFHLRATLPEIHQPSITKFSTKITYLNFIQISQGPVS